MSTALHPSQFNFALPLAEGKTLLYNFLSGESLKLNGFQWGFFRRAAEKDENHPFVRTLRERGFLVDYDERAFLRARAYAALGNGYTLDLMLCPTMACNLRCTYCFEQKAGVCHGSMSGEVESAILRTVEATLRTRRCAELKVTWYGGEPLLRPELILRMSDRLMALCARLGVAYAAYMITNGTLLSPELAAQLYARRVTGIQITLDGPREIHDASRPALNGESGFDAICGKLRALTVPMHVDLRCNIHRANAAFLPELEELARKLNEESAAHIRLYSAGVSAEPGDTEGEALELPPTQFSVGGRSVDENLLSTRPLACSKSGALALTVDSEGYLYMCERQVGKKAEAYGNILDVRDDLLSFKLSAGADRDVLAGWMNLAFPEDEECLSCTVLPLCMGGCPYDRLRGKKRCNRAKYDPAAYVRTVTHCE